MSGATYEEVFEIAWKIAEESCGAAFEATGQRPHPERRGSSIFIVWPDGEITNEIEVERIQ